MWLAAQQRKKSQAAAAADQAAAHQPAAQDVKCSFCGEPFGSRSKLFKHLRSGAPRSPTQCMQPLRLPFLPLPLPVHATTAAAFLSLSVLPVLLALPVLPVPLRIG